MEITEGNALTLQASGSLAFAQTGTGTLQLVVEGGGDVIDEDGDTQIQVEETADDDTIRFDTAGEERMVISDAGNIGVGIASPTYSLSVRNKLVVGGLADGTNDRSGEADAVISSDPENPGVLDISFFDGNAYLNQGNFQELGRLRFSANESVGSEGSDEATLKEFASIRAQLPTADGNRGNVRADLIFATANSGNTTQTALDRMIIKTTGEVGIGTNDPSQTLTVSGTAQITGALFDSSGDAGTDGQILSTTALGTNWIDAANAGTDSQTLAFGTAATTTETTLEITDGNALTLQASGSLAFAQTGTGTLQLVVEGGGDVIDADGDTQIQVEETADDDTIRFDTAGEERMLIAANGSIGMGTTTLSQTLTLNGTLGVHSQGADSYTRNTPTTTRTHNGANFESPDYTTGNGLFYTTFTTGSDVNTSQIIFEVGGSGLGTTVRINNGNFQASAGTLTTGTVPVLANTAYSLALVLDTTNNQLTIYAKQEVNATQFTASDIVGTGAFTEGDWAGADLTGVGAIAGTAKLSGGGAFTGTGLSQIDFYNTADITSISTLVPASTSPRLVVVDNGNVGIGTNNPSYELSVSGDAQVTGILYDSSEDAGTNGQILSSTSVGTNWINISTDAITDADGDTSVRAQDLDNTGATASDTLEFQVGGSNRLVLDTRGRLDIQNSNANTFIGGDAGLSNTTGMENVSLGLNTLRSATTANGNVAIGTRALSENLTANGATAVGYESQEFYRTTAATQNVS